MNAQSTFLPPTSEKCLYIMNSYWGYRNRDLDSQIREEENMITGPNVYLSPSGWAEMLSWTSTGLFRLPLICLHFKCPFFLLTNIWVMVKGGVTGEVFQFRVSIFCLRDQSTVFQRVLRWWIIFVWLVFSLTYSPHCQHPPGEILILSWTVLQHSILLSGSCYYGSSYPFTLVRIFGTICFPLHLILFDPPHSTS